MRRQKLGGRAKKTSRPPNTPKIARRRSSVITLDETSAERLSREHTEALEQQAATDEVLRIIRRSPANAQPVFDAIVESASRLCGAVFSAVYLYDDDHFRIVATNNFSREATRQILELRQQRKPDRSHIAGRAILERAITHVPDVLADPEYSREWALAGGWRSVLAVPLLRDNNPLGVLSVSKAEPIPFSDRQIQLLKTFADQALIAIENVRLFEAERQRTNDLSEALEQQTATSEVLKVISSSPGELEPVFGAMLANATRICEAKFGTLFRFDGKAFHRAAGIGVPSALAELQKKRGPYLPESGTLLDRVLQTRKVAHSPDYAAEPIPGNAAKLGGARSTVAVPMLKDSELVGAIIIYRQEVKPFTDKQIELVKNFAAQAVIAIENTRLLNELRQRTDDLTESLEQQTATSEVLRVISRSPGELAPVFKAMLENATRICQASYGVLFLREGTGFRTAATHNVPAAFADERQRNALIEPVPIDPLARLTETKQRVHISDARTEAAYKKRFAPFVAAVELGGVRTLLLTPLLREGELIGAFAIFRQEVRPFTGKQIGLADNFAAQAVIAIENARLLNELRQRTADLSEALDQQTATSEVLKIISSSPSDLRPVFQSMLENSVRICEAKFGQMFLCEGDKVRPVAQLDVPAALVQWDEQRGAFRPSPDGGLMRAILTKHVIHIDDIMSERPSLPVVKLGGARSYIAVPMLKESELVGVIVIYRQEVRPFTEKQIDLVQNFATQAVIAIENARLLNDLNKLNQQLEQRVADQVGEIERMGKLRRFLPPQVADLIVASGAEKQLEGHRREITALFCDLRGFTGFSESSDPEDVMALLREYHAAIGRIINKYGGTLERYAGDGVMVVFNDPIPVDNPALQAVLMAIDMRAAIEVLIEKWRKLGHDIGFGIGIAHGFATLGTIGFEGRFDYAAIGTVSNVASRLCDEAKPGQILISPRVLMAVEDAISVEPVGEFKLKGISRPLATYNVLSAVSAKI
jgi:GAF domain-containing protein